MNPKRRMIAAGIVIAELSAAVSLQFIPLPFALRVGLLILSLLVFNAALLGAVWPAVAPAGSQFTKDRDYAMNIRMLDRTFEFLVKIIYSFLDTVESMKKNMTEQSDAAENTSSAVTEMVASVSQINDRMGDQSEIVDVFSNTIQEMTTSIKSVSERTEEAGQIAGNISQQVKDGSEAFDKTKNAVNLIEESSQKIKNIVQIISDISDQTKLLSLNATIEAARAGDAGRGFAVVATEIKTLSDSTAESVQQIDQLMQENSTRTNELVGITQTATENLQKMLTDVEQATTIIQHISHSLKEQSAGTNEIEESNKKLLDVTQELTGAVKQQKEANTNIEEAIKLFLTTSKNMTQEIEQIGSDKFNVMDAVNRLGRIAIRLNG